MVEEERDETMFWIEMVVELNNSLNSNSSVIYKEANELLSIVVKSLSTARMSNSKK